MYKMWEIMERANTGPFCEVEDFNVKIFMPKIKELIKKYEIKFDPDSPVPADDDLADRVWQAATELFLEVGVLNVDSHRRILLDDAELREALYHAPGQYLVGAGKEARWWRHRGPEDTRPPFCIFSGDITCDEDGSVPTKMFTSIESPYFVYDALNDEHTGARARALMGRRCGPAGRGKGHLGGGRGHEKVPKTNFDF